jgi:hypothetical protein
MSTKLVGILVAVIVILLGILIAVMNSKPEQPAPAAIVAPAAAVQTEPPHLDKKRGSFKKSEPGKYGYRSPD